MAYRDQLKALTDEYASLPAGTPLRLAKRTSNLFRTRSRGSTARLHLDGFDQVMAIDVGARTADVGALTTYERLVDATLAHGLMPVVVPQLKTITLGGAVAGLGIESSSWRGGLVHESVLEIDILTGDGAVVTARADNEHRDLFFGFPNSYGTLGYALRVRIELEPVKPYVRLRHLRFHSLDELAATMSEVCESEKYTDEGGECWDVAFVDATVFSLDESYLSLASWTDDAPWTSDYTRAEIYYRSIQRRSHDWLTVRDYLWRWDTDWFWCSRAFGAQNPLVRRIVGPRLLRSDVYAKLASFEQRHHVKAAIDRRRGLPERETVIQDIEVPVANVAEFVTNLAREVPIAPVWLCPLRQRDPSVSWDLYRLDPKELYVNVGFWSTVALSDGMAPDHHNRWVESEVQRLGGRKSLYSESFYDREGFWNLYNGEIYFELKRRYDPSSRLLDLYEKCVQSR